MVVLILNGIPTSHAHSGGFGAQPRAPFALTAAARLPGPADPGGRAPSPLSALPLAAPYATWQQVAQGASPTPRAQAQLAYDPALGETVLFGGYDPAGFADSDTWVFHAGGWTDISSTLTVAPPARWGGGFVWDAADSAMILFGGRDMSQFFNDTWEFGSAGWQQLFPSTAPSPRHTSLVYDPIGQRVLLYGGGWRNLSTSGLWQSYNDTWSFVGGIWSRIVTPHAPPSIPNTPPPLVDMEYDPVAREFIARAASTAVPNEIWTFNGTDWHLRATNGAPPSYARNVTAAWDPTLGFLVLFGGITGSVALHNTTWAYRNGTWVNLTGVIATAPPVRDSQSTAFDAADGHVLVFGGDTQPPNYTYRNDTWEFVGTAWPTLHPRVVPSTPEVGSPAELEALVQGGLPPLTISWSYSDGGVGGGANTTHLFNSNGTATVTVGVTDALGEDDGARFAITVAPRLTAQFSANVTAADYGVPVSLSSAPQGGVAPYVVSWKFPEGTTATGAVVAHSYGLYGSTTTQGSVEDANGVWANGSVPLVVNSALTSSVVVANPPGCGAGSSATFAASLTGGTAPYSFRWSVDGGAAVNGSPSRSVSFSSEGAHSVSLTVRDSAGGSAHSSTSVTVPACGAPFGSSPLFIWGAVGGAIAVAAVGTMLLLRRRRRKETPRASLPETP